MARTLITATRPYIRTNLFPIFQSKNRVISTTAILSRDRSLVLSYKTIIPLVFNDGGSKASIFFGFGDGGRRGLSVGATHVNDAGSIDQPLMQSMEKKIKEQLNAELVSVRDTSGDGRHVSIDVISSAFEGQSTVNRQRMVYRAIWEELQNTVHAVDQMTTKTPSEAGAQK